jgi:hypothetical protein
MRDERYRGYLISALAVAYFGRWQPEFRVYEEVNPRKLLHRERPDHGFKTEREAEEGALSSGRYWIDKSLQDQKLP